MTYYCDSCLVIAKRIESGKAGAESVLQGYMCHMVALGEVVKSAETWSVSFAD